MKKTLTEKQKQDIIKTKTKEKKILKRILIISLIAICIILLVYFVTKSVSNAVTREKPIEQIQRVYPTITPFEADFDTDIQKIVTLYRSGKTIEQIKESQNVKSESALSYLSQTNTSIMYKTPSLLCDIEDIPKESTHGGHRFFKKYFEVLRKKDGYKEYSSLFTKEYKENPVGFEKDFTREFPPQKVYDILVEELGIFTEYDNGAVCTYNGKECSYGYYRVSYKIYHNDGYFRRDLYEEGISRQLYFELVTVDEGTSKETTYIRNIYDEESRNAAAK